MTTVLPDVFLQEPTESGERTISLEHSPTKLKALEGRMMLVQVPCSQLIKTFTTMDLKSTPHPPERRTKVLVDTGAGGGTMRHQSSRNSSRPTFGEGNQS